MLFRSPQVLTPTLYAPTILLGSAQVLGPSPQVLTSTLYAPTILLGSAQVLGPNAQSLAVMLYGPTLAVGSAQILGPAPQVLTFGQYEPNTFLIVPGVLGPNVQTLDLTLYPPSVAPITVTSCWKMYYDAGSQKWILDGGGGYVVYTMTGDFNCKGRNRFDVLMSTKTTNPIPPFVDVVPYTTVDCPCPVPTACCADLNYCLSITSPTSCLDGLVTTLDFDSQVGDTTVWITPVVEYSGCPGSPPASIQFAMDCEGSTGERKFYVTGCQNGVFDIGTIPGLCTEPFSFAGLEFGSPTTPECTAQMGLCTVTITPRLSGVSTCP